MNILFERLKEINAKRSINDIEINWGAEQDPDEGLEVANIGVSEAIPCPEVESPNDLDVDQDIDILEVPSTEEKEESMDMLCSDPYRKENTSGNTKSNVYSFLEKYAEGNDAIQILRRDLMSVTSDMHWIRESKNQHEQWALDFADALNELSVSI